MKIAILHYHLNPGGVTRIIGSQIKGLLEADPEAELMVLCGNGNTQNNLSGIPVRENTLLQYQVTDHDVMDFDREADRIKAFIEEQAGGFILHCHNPNLGKNPAVTLAVYQLAKEGYRIVNHCHDFAEDRPVNMEILNRMIRKAGRVTPQVMYPDMPNYHFIVLNTCDYERILNENIPAQRVHLLPNPVALGSYDPGKDIRELRSEILNQLQLDASKKICTYPVRAIRRKNLGELILLAVLFESSCQFVVTQGPRNPEELPGYNRWHDFCTKHRIAIKFEAGEIVNHEDLIRISDFCITTSTREGFGMAYLEPWLAGTPVSGRNLPCITADLRKAGMKIPGLYDRIMVKTESGTGDFKDLDIEKQEDFIIGMRESWGEKENLFRRNPGLEFLFAGIHPDIIRHNRQIIINHFSVANYGKRLFELYKDLSG